ncbi:MAG TPA: hypothetical protein VJ385_00130 [Fibrobacteria bacterium]|nr:hypothetical protein [Fibrobacteria bacterium]
MPNPASALAAALLAFPPASLPGQPGRFHLAAERARYLLGEPIHMRIESPESRPPSLEEGRFLLGIEGAGEPERIYHPPLRLRTAPGSASGGKTQDALPGEPRPGGAPVVHVRFARLIASDGELLFRKPGRYRLRLIPAGGAAALSDSLDVEFREPDAPADRKAYALLSRNAGEYALAVYLEGGDQLKEGMAIIAALAAFESAYSRLASFVLSSDWSQDFTDYGGNGSRPMDLQKAMAWAQWDRGPGAYVPLRNAYRLKSGAEALAAREPGAPGLEALRGRLAAFFASLSPEEKAWFRSF